MTRPQDGNPRTCSRLGLALVPLGLLLALGSSGTAEQPNEITLTIDGARRLQRFDGIGVNAHSASWKADTLKPALESLFYTMNATIWRVVLETEQGWEDQNDNEDASIFNWDFYRKRYETPKFQKTWEMMASLNELGVRDTLMLNLMGRVPEWMGKEAVLPDKEDEYVEMIVSLVYYACFERHLQFGLLGPMNEPDIRNEGPTMDARQYVRVVKKIVTRLDELGLGHLRLVGPDTAGMDKAVREYLPLMMAEPAVMQRLACVGVHSYGGYRADVRSALEKSPYPALSFWMTEWNAWRDGLDNGQIGVYDYDYAAECVRYLLDLLRNGAAAALVWEAYDSLYEHHNVYGQPPSAWSYWGVMGYDQKNETYTPRKHFYAISQISRFLTPGSYQVGVAGAQEGLAVVAFYHPESGKLAIVGENSRDTPVSLAGVLNQLPAIRMLEMSYTNAEENLRNSSEIAVKSGRFTAFIPPKCIFALSGSDAGARAVSSRPQPDDWFSGDMHVHLSCGDEPIPLDRLPDMMRAGDLDVISLLADMGNAEVKDAARDLPRVNGRDDPLSTPHRLIHWDAEWHWDATYTNFAHQALGGHLVVLGAREARQIWDESPRSILTWARKQKAVSGFAHMQYLTGQFQDDLNCCIPVNYPVEAALGSIDFISEDVSGAGSAIDAYYRLLNCGFRLGLAAGTDYPCNDRAPLGTLRTYVQVKDRKLTYSKWVEGIARGRTVVSRVGGSEFLALQVNRTATPGDEIQLGGAGPVQVEVRWSVSRLSHGRIELVRNGVVVASIDGSASLGKPLVLSTAVPFTDSGWLCARRTDGDASGHKTHTAAVYVTVNHAPLRASASDARYFIDWIDRLLTKTGPGGEWNRFFPTQLEAEQARFRQARDIYRRIARESR
jgi:O-glycosyl hydrolase